MKDKQLSLEYQSKTYKPLTYSMQFACVLRFKGTQQVSQACTAFGIPGRSIPEEQKGKNSGWGESYCSVEIDTFPDILAPRAAIYGVTQSRTRLK